MLQNLQWEKFQFQPVIDLPPDYEIYDFSKGYDANRLRTSLYGIGKYNEKRVGVYTAELFEGTRNVHMGIDIAAPVGTPIRCFTSGSILCFGYNGAKGDYGYTLVTEHSLDGTPLYTLWGHLSASSIANKVIGQKINAGEIIAWVGDRHENGDWNPHLHFQLSWVKPEKPDMPGAVSEKDREKALATYPDPRLVLGPLY